MLSWVFTLEIPPCSPLRKNTALVSIFMVSLLVLTSDIVMLLTGGESHFEVKLVYAHQWSPAKLLSLDITHFSNENGHRMMKRKSMAPLCVCVSDL